MKKSMVLLSGGLDSTVNFCKALREAEIVLALTFDYGQRAVEKEIQSAVTISHFYHVRHEVVTLEWLKRITNSALVNRKQSVPHISQESLDDRIITEKTAKTVWVPNRNGVFLNIAAAYGEVLGAHEIVVGFNAEEAATFPDNSTEFIEAVNESFKYSTLRRQKVVCYTDKLNKSDIVQLGQELRAPFHLMWSCYEGDDTPCKQCESCQRFQRAMQKKL